MSRWFALLSLAACGAPTRIAESDFAERMAAGLCDRTRECARGLYDAEYFGMSDCRESNASLLRELVTALGDSGGCDYDEGQAANAYGDLYEMSCERFFEGAYVESFTEVWDCDVFIPGFNQQ